MPLGNPIRKQNESRMVSVLATEGQTVFTVQGGYIINHISVFRNGVRLSNSEDFTAGDGSTVTLNNAANIDDRIEFHIFDRFTVQNAIIGAASTQTINGDLVLNGKLFGQLDVPSINLTGIITATELDLNGNVNVSGVSTFIDIDARNITGVAATLTGNLTISNTQPGIILTDTDSNPDYKIENANGIFNIYDETNAETRFRINSSGQIGIGTVTPRRQVHQHVRSSGANYYQWTNSTTGVSANDGLLVGINLDENAIIWNYESTAMRFATSNTERLRIASDGHVKFGDGDPVAVAAVEIENANPVLLLRDTAATSASGDCKYSFGNANHYPVASISHSWDGTNGGLHFYTRLSGTETERLAINSAGLVSIPVAGNLQVGGAGSGLTDSKIYVANTGGDAYIQIKGADSSGTVGIKLGRNSVANRAGIDWSASTDALSFRSGGTTERMRIDSSGDVEIMQGKNLLWVYEGGSTHRARIRGTSSDDLIFENGSGNTERLRITSAGRVGINKQAPETDLHIVGGSDTGIRITSSDGGTASLQLGDASDTVIGGISCLSDSSIRIRGNNNTDRIVITSGGNVAIGPNFNSPNVLLHVGGYDNAGGDVAIRIHNDTGTDSGSTASLLFTVSPTDTFDAQILRYYRESNNFVIQYATNNPTMVLTNDNKVRFGGGAHTIDPICGTGGIDIMAMGSSGAFPFVGGADNTANAVTRSANTEKQFRMGYPTYGNGAGTVCTFAYMKSSSSDNIVNIGGGTGFGYASTKIDFYAAGNTTTSTGTFLSRMDYNSRQVQYWNLVDSSMWNNSDAVDGMAFQGTGRGSMQIVCNRSNGYANVYLNKTNVNGGGSDVRFVACYWNGNAEGNIQYNTSNGNVVIAQESDYRLKKDIADMTNGIDKVKKLRPVTYQWNDLSTKPKDVTLDGFIAHEVAEVIPQAVIGSKDATKTDEDGNENVIDPQELEQKDLIPTLTAALKEAIAKIETLETKVAALEGS